MVLLHVKNRDADQFLYETSVMTPVDDVVRDISDIWNLRHRAQRLAQHAEDLCNHGIYRPEDQHGLDDAILEKDTGAKGVMERPAPSHLPENRIYNPDPCGRRNGEAPTEDLARIITKTTEDLKALVHKSQAERRIPLSKKEIVEAIETVGGAVTIVWPMGLPEYDPVRECIEGTEDLTGQAASQDLFDADNTALWFASKQMDRSKKLMDHVGKNEKSKVIVKLTKKGGSAPAKEPPLDPEGQKNLVAYWHKKQEEAKKLAEDDEDAYLHSAWANPKSLKQAFQGSGDVSWRPR